MNSISSPKPMKKTHFQLFAVLLLFVAASGTACQSVYYNTMEKFGKHKRDILVDRVDDARESQEEAKEQFQTALERFVDVTGFTGGDLAEQYKRFNTEYIRSEERAKAVRSRIESVEEVANDLFSEWKKELEVYSDRGLRQSSERQLRTTRNSYDELIDSMRQAESRMEPVLAAFQDRVLFLKHNLNAQAIASLDETSADLHQNIRELMKEMDRAIEEANAFIDSMRDDSDA